MPGFKQIIPLRLGSTPLGKFVAHPLATRPGTLLIAEAQDGPSHTPVFGEKMIIPNAAYGSAKKLLPAGTSQDQASAHFEIASGTLSSEARFQRTSKGGIHGIINQSGAGIAPGHGGKVVIPDSILEYIRTHPDNRFGFGFWGRITRKPTLPVSTGTPPQPQHFNISKTINKASPSFNASQTDTLTTLYPPGSWPVPGNYEYQGQESINQLGSWTPSFSTKWHGEIPSSINNIVGGMWWGSIGGNGNATIPNMATCFASFVFYGMFIEDLTVSGVTTAKFVEDFQKETDKNFAVGGRFYADNMSDPAVVLP